VRLKKQGRLIVRLPGIENGGSLSLYFLAAWLSPSPSKERGKRFIERGFIPLLPTLPLPLLREGGQGMGC